MPDPTRGGVRQTGRRGSVVVVLLLAVLVNLPLVHSAWQRSEIERSGVEVTATVVDHEVTAGRHLVSFRLPADVDPDRRTWQADVEPAAYRSATGSGRIRVRVLQDDPSAFIAEGQVGSRTTLVVTIAVDLLLLVLLVLWWRYGGRRRPQLRAVALEDVEQGPPGTLLERLVAEDYLIRGEVVAREDDRVLLDVGNRTVLVLLDGHENPVVEQRPAQVRVRMVG